MKRNYELELRQAVADQKMSPQGNKGTLKAAAKRYIRDALASGKIKTDAEGDELLKQIIEQ